MENENNEFCNEITCRIYEILKEKQIKGAVILFPMVRIINNKLYIGTLLEKQSKELSNKNKIVRPKFWILLDCIDYSLIELNETKNKDYMDTSIIPLDKEFNDTFKEGIKDVQKYKINKAIKYREYLLDDIKNDLVNVQKNIINNINNTLIVDNKEVNAKDYLYANIEEEVNNKINELIDLVAINKYSTIIYYYQSLIKEIINEYNSKNTINNKKIKLAANILDSYYGECYGIKYFFNV